MSWIEAAPTHSNPDRGYIGIGFPLYHYTSLESFEAIVRTHTLRASHIAYMNDWSEFRLGILMLYRVLGEARSQMSEQERAIAECIELQLKQRNLADIQTFVLCFSEDANLLSQWRAYTPHGRGVSIGFDHNLLLGRCERVKWSWTKCVYTEQGHLHVVERLARLLISDALKIGGPADAATRESLRRNEKELFLFLACLKHPAFEAEREYRLVSPPIPFTDPSINFRAGMTTLVPFYVFDLLDDEVRHFPAADLVVGPTLDPEISRHAVHAVYQKYRVERTITIHDSRIPYRML